MKDTSSEASRKDQVNSAQTATVRYRLRLGEIVSRTELLAEMAMAPATLTSWMKKGLRPLATDTREYWFLTDDLVAFWKSRNPNQ